VKTTLQHDGTSVAVELADCLLHRTGDFAGNIDLVLTANPSMAEDTVAESLRLAVPGIEERLKVVGSSLSGARVEVTFYAKALEGWTGPAPSALSAYWAVAGREVLLGRIDCT